MYFEWTFLPDTVSARNLIRQTSRAVSAPKSVFSGNSFFNWLNAKPGMVLHNCVTSGTQWLDNEETIQIRSRVHIPVASSPTQPISPARSHRVGQVRYEKFTTRSNQNWNNKHKMKPKTAFQQCPRLYRHANAMKLFHSEIQHQHSRQQTRNFLPES